MCYINGIKVSYDTWVRFKQHQKELKQLNNSLLNQPARRGFDYSEWPVIKPLIDRSDCEIVAAQWGFLPSHLKTWDDVQRFRYGWKDNLGKFHGPYTTLNATAEELLMPGKMFRESALQRRCLVLSTGFYEFRHFPEYGKKGQVLKTTNKIPYRITIPGQPLFKMAGTYNTFVDPESGEQIDTFAILTTDTKHHELMSKIHNSKNRMPVILTQELADEWIGEELSEQRISEIAAFQFPSAEMAAHPISKDFLENIDLARAHKFSEMADVVIAA